MAVDPDSLAVTCCPMAWLPNIVGTPYVVTGPVNIIRPVANFDGHRAWITSVIRSVIIRTATIATIIGSVARGGGVITSTSY
jgi:hypothetical protein